MKNLLLTATLLAGISAHASTMITNCSNADGSVVMSDLHTDNPTIIVTQKATKPDQEDQKVTLENKNLTLDYEGAKTEIEKSSGDTCAPDHTHGIGYQNEVFAVKFKITTTDDAFKSLVSNHISNVSLDRKSLSTFVVCQAYSDSMVPCR